MGQRSKLDVSGVHSSDSNDCTDQARLFQPCSARSPGAAGPRKMELWQDNGQSEAGKNSNEYPGRKEDDFVEGSEKTPTLGSSFLASPSMQMHQPVPHTELESRSDLSALAGRCQVLAFQSCSLLWLVAIAGGLLREEAKTDR